MVRDTDSFNGILIDLHTPYNDTKRRAVSLRQLSFLFKIRHFYVSQKRQKYQICCHHMGSFKLKMHQNPFSAAPPQNTTPALSPLGVDLRPFGPQYLVPSAFEPPPSQMSGCGPAVVSPLAATENLWENAPTPRENPYNLVVCPPKATNLKT